jgi:hypothetical protein
MCCDARSDQITLIGFVSQLEANWNWMQRHVDKRRALSSTAAISPRIRGIYKKPCCSGSVWRSTPAADVLTNYFKPFAFKLFLCGDHPVCQARTVGGFSDSWRADDNLGFSATAMMRYRSRHDMLTMVMNPVFADRYIHKLATIERTINWPTQMMMNAYMGPQYWVLLLLLFGASIAQNLATHRQLRT